MGYKVSRTVFPLDFSGTPYEGMEIDMYRPSTEALSDMTQLFGINADNMTKEDIAVIGRTVGHFARCLARWNLEEDERDPVTLEPTGNVVPIPATLEGVGRVEDYVILAITNVWLKTLIGEGIIKADIPQVPLETNEG